MYSTSTALGIYIWKGRACSVERLVEILTLPVGRLKRAMLLTAIALAIPQLEGYPLTWDKHRDRVWTAREILNSKAGWKLVWEDEFTGTEIDLEKWQHEVDCWGGGNNELQCYTNRRENAFVKDGLLHIVAREETFSGPALNQGDPAYDPEDTSVTRPYTSARLRSINKGNWKYGRIEVKAKLPKGQGMWPAIWMLPSEWKYGGWPASGEIDIMEAVNSGAAGGNTISGTLHYGQRWPGHEFSGTSFDPESFVWEQFHTYALEWQSGEIRWYVDSTHYATQTQDGWFNYYYAGQNEGFKVGSGAAPFDQAFYLLLNLAVGGNWPGDPDATTEFPQTFLIDSVRVYQCQKKPESGAGCATFVDESLQPLPGNQAPQVKQIPLYTEGPDTLVANLEHTEVDRRLAFGTRAFDFGRVVATEKKLGGNHGRVWDVRFNGAGKVYLYSGDAPNATGIETGVQFNGMENGGEIVFDLLVNNISPNTRLTVKFDSGRPNRNAYALAIPPTGQWTRVSVPIADIASNSGETGAVDLQKVINLFVLEAGGDAVAHLQLDNIRLLCPGVCSVDAIVPDKPLTEILPLYTDSVYQLWDVGAWDTFMNTYYYGGNTRSAHINWSEVDSGDDHGRVLDVHFLDDKSNGVFLVRSSSGHDATSFAADGKLRFDIRVLDYGINTSGMVIRVDCDFPCSSGDFPIGVVGNGGWESVEIPVRELLHHNGSTLDLSNVNIPFAIFPTWGEQRGVHLQLDNMRWVGGLPLKVLPSDEVGAER